MNCLKRLFIIYIAANSWILTGCGSEGDSFSLLSDSNSFINENSSFNNKLDILFVINDEPSMSSHQADLVTSFQSFIDGFVTKGFDYKIAVVTTSGYLADPTLNGYDPADEDAADFNDYNGSIHSNIFVLNPLDLNILADFAINAQPTKNSAGQDGRSFSSFRQALQSTRPINLGFLRPDSFLAVVIVENSDDFSGNGRCNGCNVNQKYNAPTLDPVSTYKDFLSTITGTSGATARYNVSAMTQMNSPCQGNGLMTRIMDLVTQTNGILGDICQNDFGPDMTNIAGQIAMLSTQFYLDRIPVEDSILVKVNGVVVVEDSVNGWSYNSASNSILFHGTSTPAQGDSIVVTFDPLFYGS